MKKDRNELRKSIEAQVDLPLFEFHDNLDIERFLALSLNQQYEYKVDVKQISKIFKT